MYHLFEVYAKHFSIKKQWFMALGKFHRYMASILSGHEICNVELRHPNASKAKPQQGQLPSSVK